MKKILATYIFFTAGLVACSVDFSAGTPSKIAGDHDATQENNAPAAVSPAAYKQIMTHCVDISAFADEYAKLRAIGQPVEQARETAVDHVFYKFASPQDNANWAKLTRSYTSLIESLARKTPNMTREFALTQCLTANALKKELPIASSVGRGEINAVLDRCEASSQSEDTRGACVLRDLRPLAH